MNDLYRKDCLARSETSAIVLAQILKATVYVFNLPCSVGVSSEKCKGAVKKVTSSGKIFELK